MYEIVLMNDRGEKFTKKYTSYFLYNQALIKYKHSKNLRIISYGKEVW